MSDQHFINNPYHFPQMAYNYILTDTANPMQNYAVLLRAPHLPVQMSPNPPYPQSLPRPSPQLAIQAPPQALPTQPSPQLPPKQIAPQQKPKPTQTINETNAKIKNIKEKCISHYIDGQLIIESSKPLVIVEKKKLRKRKRQQQGSQPSTPQQQQNQQQNQLQLQQHHQQQTQQNVAVVQQRLPQPIAAAPPQTPTRGLSTQGPQQQSQQQQQQQVVPSPQTLQRTPPRETPTKEPPAKKPNISDSDSIQKIRTEMVNWSVDKVVEFIDRHDDIKQYSSKFAEDEIDGKALLLMIDRNLNFQVLTSMFKHGPAIKIEATLSKYKINSNTHEDY